MIAIRLLHFAATVALFGELAFLVWVARPAGESLQLRGRTLRVAACCSRSYSSPVSSGSRWKR